MAPELTLSPARRAYLRQKKKTRLRVRSWQILLLIFLLGFWELTCALGWSDGFLTSSPSRMVRTLVELWRSGDLWHHVGISCLEMLLGFAIGTISGTLIAAGMWWSDMASRVLEPYLVVLNALPKTALGPIFILWMGPGMGAIVAMTLAISLIVTVLSMYQGFIGTDPEKLRLMKTLGATRWQTFRLLVLPGSYGVLLNTMRVNVGLSWVGAIMGEFLVSKAGLGYLIVYGSQVFNMDLVMTGVLVLGICAVGMYGAMLFLENKGRK